jgi:predicted MPP superfamily phosphohydrolase
VNEPARSEAVASGASGESRVAAASAGSAGASTHGRPSLGMLVAILVFTSLLVAIHVYFAQRLVLDTALPAPWSTLGIAALALAGVSIFARPLAELRFGPTGGALLGWPSHLWLGCCFYLLIALGLGDAVTSLVGADGVSAARTQAVAAFGVVAVLAVLGTRSVLAGPALVRVEHAIPGWPSALDGYRIVQLSDVHVGAILRRPFIEQLVARCNALEPDAVAITGDLVDGALKHYGGDVEPLRALLARDGVFFVTGNHDHYSGGEPWAQHVAELGIRVLRNARVRIERDGAGFELAGVDDYSAGRLDGGHGHDLERALAGWDGSPLVLMAHDPRSFPEAQARGVHLQLSGHTHGGQMWPFAWFVRLQTPHVAGVYERGGSRLYVSRGTGFWGPPMRVLAPAEITLHVMRRAG